MRYPNPAFDSYQGLGMTSQRTRNRLVDRLMEKGVTDDRVLDTMRVVPRHLFLDEAMSSRSYEDTALPIGYGQTISQPWVVAKMTQWLLESPIPIKKVLEIGTGSGYQTAILSLLVDEVYSVERIQALSERAEITLNKLELENIQFSLSDGHWGWSDKAPFDAIISAASPAELPQELINQLKVGGRLVMPIGESRQLLYGFEKTSTGVIETCLGEVMFVPMKAGVES
ncbi:MAG: protein-L-isoaspartate(D-aspartate) O-methyltransferase [Pseudomonadota bacterium]|nr:protein-L-isoaspartate(D-aspartate) O-methyltransferase [Pseudomonadota bacterium]